MRAGPRRGTGSSRRFRALIPYARLVSAHSRDCARGVAGARAGGAGTALAHDVSTAAGHRAEDTVLHDAAIEAQPEQGDAARLFGAVARGRGSRRGRSGAGRAVGPGGRIGRWSEFTWPCCRTGKCSPGTRSAMRATESFPDQTFTRATVYDPVTGTQTPVNVDTGYNIFCAGFAHLIDGSLFIAGGNKDQQLNGIVQTHLFNPVTNTLEPRPGYGGRSLVSVRHAADERRDADHRGRSGHAGGAEDRRDAAGAEHRLAEPAALSLDGRCARTAASSTPGPIRRCASSTRPAAARGRASGSATPSTAATAATRSSTSARRSSPAAGRRRTTRA